MPDAGREGRVGLVVLLLLAMAGTSLWAQETAPARQAVVETSAGTFIIDLDARAAPGHVAHFVSVAEKGGYEGTIFHRVVRNGMVQGGDPVTRDPARRSLYGTGGLGVVKDEAKAPRMTGGSVAAVTVPGRSDSAGSQFFIVIVDQPGLDGRYTVFGHVADGMETLQAISQTPVDADGVTTERVTIQRVTVRNTPPPQAPPFTTETVEQLRGYRAVLDTSLGPITIEFLADKAPGHVRQFLRLAQAGVYDGMAFHRVAPGFVTQTGALISRMSPLTARQQGLVVNLPPEFNDTRHVRGIVSMARGDDPASATTSFFICLAEATALDGQYTAFARVVGGMDVIARIEGVDRIGESPASRIDLKSVRVEGPGR